jgi:hypothetical protein
VIRHLDFADESTAKRYLETLLTPFFLLKREVWCRHLLAGNRLRIDYVARPQTVEFPFDWFGIEVKRSCQSGGLYNQALKQAIDYTACVIDDTRPTLARINGNRIERVYVFPARGDNRDLYGSTRELHEAFWVNRLAGRFHVGMIYEMFDGPAFFACADKQWSVTYGPRASKHNSRQLVGSGAKRRSVWSARLPLHQAEEQAP